MVSAVPQPPSSPARHLLLVWGDEWEARDLETEGCKWWGIAQAAEDSLATTKLWCGLIASD